MTLVQIPLGQVIPPTDAVRSRYDRRALEGLTRSVIEHGVLNPITVVRNPHTYRLVAGMRRFLAAVEAKLETIPAHVVEADSQRAYELGLVENIQREDMDPIDEAKAIQTLMRALGIGTDRVARRLGKTGKWVYDRLRLLETVPEVQHAVKAGEISITEARGLATADPDEQRDRVRVGQTRSPRQTAKRAPTWRQKAAKLLQWKLTDEEGAILLDTIERTIREIRAGRGRTP